MADLQVLGEVDLNETPAKASSGPTVLGEVDLADIFDEVATPATSDIFDQVAQGSSKAAASAELDRTSRLASSPELPAARNRLDIGGPHQGTATQEVERQAGPPLTLAPSRKAAPLAVPPATEHQITPVGRPALAGAGALDESMRENPVLALAPPGTPQPPGDESHAKGSERVRSGTARGRRSGISPFGRPEAAADAWAGQAA